MKIFNDKTAPGLISEKNETQGRVSKKTGSEKSAPVKLSADELELTSKKTVATSAAYETEMANAAAVEFDATQVPMMRQKLQFINNYILSNPAEALSAQANLNPEMVAGLIG